MIYLISLLMWIGCAINILLTNKEPLYKIKNKSFNFNTAIILMIVGAPFIIIAQALDDLIALLLEIEEDDSNNIWNSQ